MCNINITSGEIKINVSLLFESDLIYKKNLLELGGTGMDKGTKQTVLSFSLSFSTIIFFMWMFDGSAAFHFASSLHHSSLILFYHNQDRVSHSQQQRELQITLEGKE